MNPIDLSVPSPSTNTFNPPPGSRVLALKSRVPSGSGGPPGAGMHQLPPPGIAAPHAHALPPGASGIPIHLSETIPNDAHFGGARIPPSDSRGIRSFSPLSNGSQPNLPLEDLRESMHLGPMHEGLRRTSGSSAAERAILGHPGEAGLPFVDIGGPQPGGFPPSGSLDPSVNNIPGGANYAVSKGSRFAKFFDPKTREAHVAGPRLGQQGPAIPPTMAHPNQRQESISLGGMSIPRGERTMEDIFAMLQSSAQVRDSFSYYDSLLS